MTDEVDVKRSHTRREMRVRASELYSVHQYIYSQEPFEYVLMNHRHLFEIAQTLDFEVRFKLVEPLDIIAFAEKFHKIPHVVSGSDPAERIYSCKYRSFTKELTPQINANLWYMYSVVLSFMADEEVVVLCERHGHRGRGADGPIIGLMTERLFI